MENGHVAHHHPGATEGKTPVLPLDAGLRSLDHYKRRLPKWRHSIRNLLMPVVRWETPFLALMQSKCRSPALDYYFASTANLGTHTFFMIILPILFWCGYTKLGRAMVNVLASGVYFSGFLKDLLCIPRPLSPPLKRISRSASAVLEYGFPSTHSTNSVSVAVYTIYALRESANTDPSRINFLAQAIFYFYATSIVFGRLYCGMHGIFDVVCGSLLGAAIGALQFLYGDVFNSWIVDGPFGIVVLFILIVLVLVRIHPEPADDCPCFDDSVSFSGVILGCQLGAWCYARSGLAWTDPVTSTVPFLLKDIGLLRAILRIVTGVVIVFAWRGIMKPTLLKCLPPIFRIIETQGLSLPRKFFLQASQYTSVPPLRRDDNVIPRASEIPGMIRSLGQLRKRAVSVGPQSEADAYETMAFRARRRRESINESDGSSTRINVNGALPEGEIFKEGLSPVLGAALEKPPRSPWTTNAIANGSLSESASSEPPEHKPGISFSNNVIVDGETLTSHNLAIEAAEEDEQHDREMFRKLEKPRIRYDVEVITKLVVYTGIGWLSVHIIPTLFEFIGLGLS